MRPDNAVWLAIGVIVGACVWLYQVDAREVTGCQLYKVAKRPVTAFVLKPPVAESAKCEVFQPSPIVQPLVSKTVENDTQQNLSVTDDTQTEEKPKRKHHRRRHWRRW